MEARRLLARLEAALLLLLLLLELELSTRRRAWSARVAALSSLKVDRMAAGVRCRSEVSVGSFAAFVRRL